MRETRQTDEECPGHGNNTCKGSGTAEAFSHYKYRKRGLGRGRRETWSLAAGLGEGKDGHKLRLILVEGCGSVGYKDSSRPAWATKKVGLGGRAP